MQALISIVLMIFNVIIIVVSLIINLILLPFRLMIAGVRKLLGIPPKSRRPTDSEVAEELEMRSEIKGNSASFKLNLDKMDRDEQEGFLETVVGKTNFDLFEGHVKHGYDLKHVADKDTCPKCKALTKQMYANFVYATNVAPRVMFAPAGYFCQECPTVIVDQKMLRGGISRGFTFKGVLGIDRERGGDFDGFGTWNGKKAVYLVDEIEGTLSLTTIDKAPEGTISAQAYYDSTQHFRKKREKTRKQKKLAKQARKKKRRKK